MKKLLAILLCISALAADDRVSTYTSNASRTITRSVQSVTLMYDNSISAVPLQRISIRSWTSYSDGTPGRYTVEEYSKAQLEALPTMATNANGVLVTNTFRTAMLARWTACDLIPDNALAGWRNPLFMVPPQEGENR